MNQPKQILTLVGRNYLTAFHFPTTRRQVWGNRLWIGFLFILGIAAWGVLFSWGNFTVDFHDWASITAPRFQFLKNAISTIQFPLHISNPATLNYATDRYLSVPDSFISPQFIFLRWLDIPTFTFLNLLLFYAIGFWGLILVKQRFRLSAASFSVLFILFNFNGHIIAHNSVGHATWNGYFLFPFFVLLIFDMLKGDNSWAWVAKLSLLLFVMFLQGSFHQFVWCILLMCMIAVLIPNTFWRAFRGVLFACLMAMPKILPPALLYDKFENKFITGYPTFGSLWEALVSVRVPGDLTLSDGLTKAIGVWELTLFVGLLGALFLIGFGLVSWLRRSNTEIDRRLITPLTALTLLTLGNMYQYFRYLQLPLFNGERVSTRMISLVFTFILIIAVVEFQHWLDQSHPIPWVYGTIGLGIVMIGHDLWQNLNLWRINNAVELFTAEYFDPGMWHVANNYGDGGYLLFIVGGCGICILTIIVLGVMIRRERKPKPKPIQADD